MAFLFLEKEKTKRKQKKQGSLEEALADLDDIPSLGISRKSQKIKVYQQNKDCLTGKYEVKSTKTYPRKKKVVKALKSNAGPAVASSSSTYDLPDYQVEPNSIDDDFMESEREYYPEFLTMLDEIEKDIPFKMEKTAWERRKVNLEGNWANARNDLFHALLLRNSIPEKHAVCCKRNLNEAVIKCQECRKFLCSECDGILHNKCPFHNRNVWINGFYEGIRNNETVFDSNIITIASLNRNSSTTIVNQLAEYFKLHEELFSVPIVDKFMDNTDKASSILTGQEELYSLLNSTKENYGRKKKRMAVLERKLFCDSSYTKEEALRDGKEQLTEQTIDVLRTQLVHIYINLKQQKLEVSKLADSSKKRINIRKQISKNTSVLESTVDKYNLVSSISSKRYSKLEKADVALGKFAWQTDAAEFYVVPVWLCKQIVDKNSWLMNVIYIAALNSGGENSNIIESLSTSDAQIKKALGFNPVQLTIAEEENSEEPEFSDENDDDEE
eukprot:gene14508-16017_t